MSVLFLIFFWIRSVKNGSNFLARNGFLAIMAFLQKLLFRPKILLSNLKWLFSQKHFFLATKGFFQINLPCLSKYWKIWLAFDGWKLSGLLNLEIVVNSNSCCNVLIFYLINWIFAAEIIPGRKLYEKIQYALFKNASVYKPCIALSLDSWNL